MAAVKKRTTVDTHIIPQDIAPKETFAGGVGRAAAGAIGPSDGRLSVGRIGEEKRVAAPNVVV